MDKAKFTYSPKDAEIAIKNREHQEREESLKTICDVINEAILRGSPRIDTVTLNQNHTVFTSAGPSLLAEALDLYRKDGWEVSVTGNEVILTPKKK